MEDYIMTSIETDVQFVDNASDSYMSDEEREYWIDLEEGVTDEEITYICDCCEETFNEEEMVIGANTEGICGTEDDYCKACNDLTEEQRETMQEEEPYQMTDEEQKGFEQYLVDTREDVPECMDAKVSLFWDTYAGYSSPRQRAEEIAEEKAEEKAKRLDAGRRAKENHIPEYAGVRSLTNEAVEKLNNHFNA